MKKSDVTQKATDDATSTTAKAGQPFFASAIQPKLSVGSVGDPFEQEADAMADHVMDTPNSHSSGNSFFKASPPAISRKCAHCEEEEKKLHRKEGEAADSGSGALSYGGATPPVDASTESYVGSLNGKGRSLTPEEKGFFEPRFGYDFSKVQLHTDTGAGESAQNINAKA
jgi:hypothetical protein